MASAMPAHIAGAWSHRTYTHYGCLPRCPLLTITHKWYIMQPSPIDTPEHSLFVLLCGGLLYSIHLWCMMYMVEYFPTDLARSISLLILVGIYLYVCRWQPTGNAWIKYFNSIRFHDLLSISSHLTYKFNRRTKNRFDSSAIECIFWSVRKRTEQTRLLALCMRHEIVNACFFAPLLHMHKFIIYRWRSDSPISHTSHRRTV